MSFIANADFDTAEWLSEIPNAINAIDAQILLDTNHEHTLFAIMVRPTSPTKPEVVTIANDDYRLNDLYNEFKDVFPQKLSRLPASRGHLNHKIDLIDEKSPSSGYTKQFSTLEMEMLKKEIDNLLSMGYITLSNSPFGAPCFFVRKPHGDGFRLVVDWRNLNNNTIKDTTQLPNIADLLAQLSKARIFSKLDGHSGFWQVLIRDGDQHKTAMRTPFGNYEWNVMGMGLTNAPATYQTLMNSILRPLLRKSVLVYLDDVLIFSNTMEEHLQHLRQVLELLRKNNIYCKPSKCTLGASEITFLGHVVGHGLLKVDPEKVDKIMSLEKPTSKSEIRTFLGIVEYLAWYLLDYSEIAIPLTDATHKHVAFNWSEKCDHAFNEIKRMVASAPVLMIPDINKTFIVATDASIHSCGAVLLQEDSNNQRRPVGYFSRKFNDSEFKWPTRDKEAKAILDAIEHWTYYLKGRYFIVETDHNSLQYLRTQRDILPRQERLLDVLADYDFKIAYVKGSSNGRADGLSRLPQLNLQPAATDSSVPSTSNKFHGTSIQIDEDLLSEIVIGYDNAPFFKRILMQISGKMNGTSSHVWHNDENGLLWLHDPALNTQRLGIPNSATQLKLMQEGHDTKTANHQAYQSTLDLLRLRFFWPGMANMIRKFVESCELCQRARKEQDTGSAHASGAPNPTLVTSWHGFRYEASSDQDRQLHSNSCVDTGNYPISFINTSINGLFISCNRCYETVDAFVAITKFS